jgi:hypothetical protein
MNLKFQALFMAIFCLSMSVVQAQQPPDFNAKKAAGIFQYDIEKVMKSLKISDDTTKQKISEALMAYNNKMFDLSTEHASVFRELEDEFDRNVQIAMQRRDRSQMNGVKAKIKRIIPPIRMQVTAEEKILNDGMLMMLTEKQNMKWLKYQRRIKG